VTLIVSIVGVLIGDSGLGTENIIGLFCFCFLSPLNRSIDLNFAVGTIYAILSITNQLTRNLFMFGTHRKIRKRKPRRTVVGRCFARPFLSPRPEWSLRCTSVPNFLIM